MRPSSERYTGRMTERERYDPAWRDLMWRRLRLAAVIAATVAAAVMARDSLFSSGLIIIAGFALALAAARHIGEFRCPRCSDPFFGAKTRFGFQSLLSRHCSSCGLERGSSPYPFLSRP